MGTVKGFIIQAESGEFWVSSIQGRLRTSGDIKAAWFTESFDTALDTANYLASLHGQAFAPTPHEFIEPEREPTACERNGGCSGCNWGAADH